MVLILLQINLFFQKRQDQKDKSFEFIQRKTINIYFFLPFRKLLQEKILYGCNIYSKKMATRFRKSRKQNKTKQNQTKRNKTKRNKSKKYLKRIFGGLVNTESITEFFNNNPSANIVNLKTKEGKTFIISRNIPSRISFLDKKKIDNDITEIQKSNISQEEKNTKMLEYIINFQLESKKITPDNISILNPDTSDKASEVYLNKVEKQGENYWEDSNFILDHGARSDPNVYNKYG